MLIALLLTSWFTFVELNCENLFDCMHDEGKNDYEYLPTSKRKWDRGKYWKKVNRISKTILSCGGDDDNWQLPDMVALCEVENDTVLHDIVRRSLLRNAGYEYVMTDSRDERGIDVALLYSPFSFRMLDHYALRVEPPEGRHATRDILYVKGQVISDDTLHVFVVHAPSRVDGEKATRPYRLRVADSLCGAIDSIRRVDGGAHVVVAGDFNDYAGDSALVRIARHDMIEVSHDAGGRHGAKGTYKYKGRWGSLDHIFVSRPLYDRLVECRIHDEEFLLEDDEHYGGKQPHRTYVGMRYHDGYSDHLPLVARFRLSD